MEHKTLLEQIQELENNDNFQAYTHKWIHKDIFYDAYILKINFNWVEKLMRNNDYVNLYTTIIIGLQQHLRHNHYNYNDDEKKYLQERLIDNRRRFYKELSYLIQDFCIE